VETEVEVREQTTNPADLDMTVKAEMLEKYKASHMVSGPTVIVPQKLEEPNMSSMEDIDISSSENQDGDKNAPPVES
jgi:hypothetical protein